MRYIINFQVKITNDQVVDEIVRSSYSILENEVKKNNLSNFINVENWFKNIFKEKPLDYFIDTSKLKNKKGTLDMKIGRITNSSSGEYKTF